MIDSLPIARGRWRAPLSPMVGTEVLKLRRRRGLFWATVALSLAPIVVGYAVVAVQHAVDPAEFGPAGGVENLRGSMEMLAALVTVAATLVGVSAGSADVQAGVFRELVATGRSRVLLFLVRVPGGLAFLAPFVIAATALAGGGSIVLAGSEEAPGVELVLQYAGWVALVAVTSYLLALGVGSVVSGRVAIALALGWQFAVTPILHQTGQLDAALLVAALQRLEPHHGPDVDLPLSTALVTISIWMFVPLAVGAWRTATRDG